MRASRRSRGVEVRQRLVEKQHVGAGRDGAGESHALLLTTGELAGAALDESVERQSVRDRLGRGAALGLPHAADPQRVGDVVADIHVREQRVVLEDHRDAALARLRIRNVFLADRELSGGDALQTRDRPQQRGLPAAGGAEEREELAVRDLDVDTVDAAHPAGVLLDEFGCNDGGHQDLIPPWKRKP